MDLGSPLSVCLVAHVGNLDGSVNQANETATLAVSHRFDRENGPQTTEYTLRLGKCREQITNLKIN